MSDGPADRSHMSSRRHLLKRGALVAGGAVAVAAALAARPAAAATKNSQKAVDYKPTPTGSARCDKCTYWEGPASCKLVDGVISPSGWCSLYAPKS